MSKIYQVVTGIDYEGLCINQYWKAFTTKEAADEYAESLMDEKTILFDYIGIVEMELE
jgi:hypothetical protein